MSYSALAVPTASFSSPTAPPPPPGHSAWRGCSWTAGRLTWLATVLAVATIWTLVAWVVQREHDQARREQVSQVSLHAKGFSEYVGLHVLTVDRLLKGLRESYLRTGAVAPHHVLVGDLGQLAPFLLQVAVADERGHVLASSLGTSSGVTIADRPHFRAFAADPRDRLHFSEPVVGRISGKISLQLVRPVLDAAGQFRGVIVASIDPVRLQQYFDSLDALSGLGSVLIAGREDGVVRVRFTADAITGGQSLTGSRAWKTMSALPMGQHRVASVVDGVDRVVGFHQVGTYPLVVAVSLAAASPAELLRPRTVLILLLASAFSIVLVLVAARRARLAQEQQLVSERLRESSRREAEANQMQTNFLASVSQDLRTPLDSILGYSGLIRESAEDPSTVHFADLIHASGKHLHALVDTLLDLAKIEAGRMELHWEQVDLSQLLSTLAQVHLVSAEQKGLDLSLTAPSEPLAIDTDRTRLTQVLNNLVDNAVKFTARGGIWLSVTDGGESVRIRVVDTGVGIPAEKLPRVFERFGSLGGDADVAHGPGLGLALARDLVHLLGGEIQITSEPWAGTEVEVLLPKRKGARDGP